MNLTRNERLALFVGIFLIVMATVTWALRQAWITLAEVEQLDARFQAKVGNSAEDLAEVQRQYLNLANTIQKNLTELDTLLLAHANRPTPETLQTFRHKSDALKTALRQQRATSRQVKLTFLVHSTNDPNQIIEFSADIRQLLDTTDQAYTAYLTAAHDVMMAAPFSDTGQNLKLLLTAQDHSRQVLLLAQRAAMKSEAINLARFYTREWYPEMYRVISDSIRPLHRRLIWASFAATAGLCTVFFILIYRLWISPLRHKVVEKDTIIQRQERFAHLGELAAVVAHEIKNPLTAINARLYALQHALDAGSSEHTDATVIRTEIERLDQIVKDFLKLDRPNGGTAAPMTAETLIHEIRDLFSAQLEKQNITLRLDNISSRPFRGDARQLKHVLINLVQNAAESIHHDGTITIRARRATARIKGQDLDAIYIEVEDTGPGITTEVQERLFHPFFTTKTDGTGLGLPISARIVDKLGGKLDFQTRLDHGTTFRIIMPACEQPE